MKNLFAVLLAITLCGCARPQGVGGLYDLVDTSSGDRVLSTGKGYIHCQHDDGQPCALSWMLAFSWSSAAPDFVAVDVVDATAEGIAGLELNLDGRASSLSSMDGATGFSSAGPFAGDSPQSHRRFFLPLQTARRLLAAQKALVRVEYLGDKVSAGDFNQAADGGQAAARELLLRLQQRVDSTGAGQGS